ncbi:MAG: hypothetical protein ABFS34_04810 [Gemmatimonadota bacterium]
MGPLPAKLVCEDETNPESGSDDIDLDVNVDGMGWHTRGHAEFDCNDKEHFRNWNSEIGVIRYLESAQIRPVEGDDVSADDIGPAFTPDAWPAATNVATTPSRHVLDYKWDGGHYTFHFNLGKWLVQ